MWSFFMILIGFNAGFIAGAAWSSVDWEREVNPVKRRADDDVWGM